MSESRSWTGSEFHKREPAAAKVVAVTAECAWHHASWNIGWPQRTPGAVGHETATISQVERRLPKQWLADQTCHRELDTVANG